MAEKIKIDSEKMRRTKPVASKKESKQEPLSVSAGPVDKVIELAFNPTRDKIREVTVIDRMQGKFFPQLDMLNMMMHYCLEVSYFRQDPAKYEEVFEQDRPVQPDLIEELMFRSAQWQKSIAGKNLERAIDIALAETEAKAGDDDFGKKANDYYQD